jgi:aminoglycoside phosphotransferase family enzyme/predicted kinase
MAFLSDPASYGCDVRAVERHETQGSVVFLAGDRAYKLKRAVRYDYMDYSTPERRRAMCEAELAANRRFAPELYLGVSAIVRAPDGNMGFGKSDAADALDWVVVMRRFAQAQLLEEMRKVNGLSAPLLRSLAETVAVVHGSAEQNDERGGRAGIVRVVEENLRLLKSFAGRPFPSDPLLAYEVSVRESLSALAARLDERRRDGFVRRCHGDLHLNNICLLNGTPTPFDAIEFDEDFTTIDVFYDLAFLLMDIDRHGLREEANLVLNRYLERTLDYGGVPCLPLFLSCRAAMRGHIAATLASSIEQCSRRESLIADALDLFDLAMGCLEPVPPRLIVLGGVSGTGKSGLAAKLASHLGRRPGAVVLRSDVLRKALFGLPDDARLPEDAYTPEVTRCVYQRLEMETGVLLDSGHSVIADAVYGRAEERFAIAEVARHTGAQFDAMWLTAPTDVLESRVAARKGDASDATVSVLRAQLKSIHPPDNWRILDAGGPADCTLTEAGLVLGLQKLPR